MPESVDLKRITRTIDEVIDDMSDWGAQGEELAADLEDLKAQVESLCEQYQGEDQEPPFDVHKLD